MLGSILNNLYVFQFISILLHNFVEVFEFFGPLRLCCADGSLFLHRSDIHQCVVVTEIGAERDDLALSTMTSNIFRLLQLPVHG